MTKHDQTVSGIVRRHPYADTVPHHNADIESSHFSAKLGVDRNLVIKFNLVDAPCESIDHFTVYLC